MNVIKRLYNWLYSDSKYWVITCVLVGSWHIFREHHWGWKAVGVFMVFGAGSETQRLLTEWKKKRIRERFARECEKADWVGGSDE